MDNRDARYTLEGMIETEEGYFSVSSSEIEQSKGKKGRGAAGKQNVAVMAESSNPLEDPDTGKKSKHVRYFKAKVLYTHKSEEVDYTLNESLQDKANVFTDKSTGLATKRWTIG